MFIEVETAFRDLLVCLQAAKIYGLEHPSFRKCSRKAYLSFQEAFGAREQIVIGIVGTELAFEKEILFELGKMLQEAIIYLKERNIERLSFSRGMTQEELEKFIAFICGKKEEFQEDPQQQLSLLGVSNIVVGKLKFSGELPDEKINSIRRLNLYDSSAKKVSQAIDGVLESGKIDNFGLKFSVNNIMENLVAGKSDILKLATLKRYDLQTYMHMLNVSIFAMYFSSRLGFNREDVMNIGVAALFHDIGKLYISRKVLNKESKLSEDEFNRIKSHTLMGAELMFKYIDDLGLLPVVVAFEHHLKHDLSGYPKTPFMRAPHIASSIVSICDVYDALSQRRGYKQDYSPDLVHDIMMREKGSSFDPQLLERFFSVVGIWPAGAIVLLSDSSVAVVRQVNEEDIYRPKVEVISPDERKANIDLLQNRDLKIERYLSPWGEGKAFLGKIN